MREYVVNCNIIVIAKNEQEAIEKAKNGEARDITIINVFSEAWGG